MPTKQKSRVRLPNGNFASKKDVTPAIFESNYDGHTIVMDSYDSKKEKIGKRIKFGSNGIYETKDQDEIDFLKKHVRTSGPVTRIRLVKDVELKEEKKGKGDK